MVQTIETAEEFLFSHAGNRITVVAPCGEANFTPEMARNFVEGKSKHVLLHLIKKEWKNGILVRIPSRMLLEGVVTCAYYSLEDEMWVIKIR